MEEEINEERIKQGRKPFEYKDEIEEKHIKVSTTDKESGCMKWYTFNDKEGTSTVNLILDHNTTARVAWNSSNSNSEMKEVLDSLTNDTSNWKIPARLITANEIAKITNHPTFDSNKTGQAWYCLATNKKDYDGASPYCNKETNISMNWLFDYTYCKEGSNDWGCSHNATSTYGYWTSTPYTGSSSYAWIVRRGGNLDYSVSNTSHGVRQVITLSKDIIK